MLEVIPTWLARKGESQGYASDPIVDHASKLTRGNDSFTGGLAFSDGIELFALKGGSVQMDAVTAKEQVSLRTSPRIPSYQPRGKAWHLHCTYPGTAEDIHPHTLTEFCFRNKQSLFLPGLLERKRYHVNLNSSCHQNTFSLGPLVTVGTDD